MAWSNEDGTHEGWDAAVFPGGQVSVGWAGGKGVMVRTPGPDGRLAYNGEPDIIVDGRTATGWQAMCECGWRGPLHTAGAADANEYADPPEGIEDAMHAEWIAHLPSRALSEIRAIAAGIRDAQARLEDAVRRARDEDATWAAIGEAAGMTRQSAHERWGKTVAEEIRELVAARPPRWPSPASPDDRQGSA